MNFLSRKLKETKKAIAHYWNPNSNPTEKDKRAFQLLNKAAVDEFILFMEENPDVNLNVVDYDHTSLLIKAQDVANDTNIFKHMHSNQELKNRAIKAVEYLLKRGVDINYRDKNGTTALLSACHWGNNQIAKILLEHGADVNLGSDNNFFTNPLLSAYYKQNMDLVILLLQYNADVEIAIQFLKKGKTMNLKKQEIDFLWLLGNIAVLVRKRKTEQHQKKDTFLSGISDMVFEEICYNI